MLLEQLPKQRSPQRVSLLLRMFVALREVKPLVEMATDEIFHELGYMAEIEAFLEKLSVSEDISAEDRFAALDGLVFHLFRKHARDDVDQKLTLMERLVAEHGLGDYEKQTVAMKRMNFHAEDGNAEAAAVAMEALLKTLPDRADYRRIANYNIARAWFSLGHEEACVAITQQLIPEYYDLLGLTPAQVTGNNPDKIWPLIRKDPDPTDDLKHLADALDLQAMALERLGRFSPLGRIHAMKFYTLAHSLDSFVRVGQDLVDEFVKRADYIAALDVFERNLIPTIVGLKLASHVIAVRSHYAVVLAHAGRFGAADAEMARLAPYESGLTEQARLELQRARQLIGRLKIVPPKPQWQMPQLSHKQPVNSLCLCGSGKKFKKCHGKRVD